MKHDWCWQRASKKRDELRDEEIYLLPAISKEDARKENLCLKRRKSSKGENQNQEFRAVQ